MAWKQVQKPMAVKRNNAGTVQYANVLTTTTAATTKDKSFTATTSRGANFEKYKIKYTTTGSPTKGTVSLIRKTQVGVNTQTTTVKKVTGITTTGTVSATTTTHLMGNISYTLNLKGIGGGSIAIPTAKVSINSLTTLAQR